MSETSDGRRNPFDLFGSPAAQDEADQGPDLSELMRQEAGKSPLGDEQRVESVAQPVEPTVPAIVEQAPVEPQPVEPQSVEPQSVEPQSVEPQSVEPQPLEAEPVAAPIDRTPAPAREDPTPEPLPEPPWPQHVAAAEPAPPRPRPAAPVRVRAPEARPPEPLDGRKLWVLRILLLSNLAMMAMMLVLPHPLEPRTEYVPDEAGTDGSANPRGAIPALRGAIPALVDPFAPPVPRRGLGLPDDALYESALLMALDGDFDGACAQLERMLEIQPDMNPAVAQLVHAHLGYYLRKAGRLAEAIEHEALARQQSGWSQMPDELLRSARAAETRGDGDAMRRAYAQFLLQEGQLSPEMRALVPEALLKLGDSYRVQAASGEEAAEERSR